MISTTVRALALLAVTCGLILPLQAQTPAFPGALGFGQYATGGRSGSVYHVTTLADSGTGSFRTAVGSGNRIVVFDVGGTITLASAVTCANNLTIAGQTAPGGGIAIIGHEVSFSVRSNEIIRYVRFRPGSLAASTEDGLNIGDATNMILDHCSIEFAPYNNIDAVGSDSNSHLITVQNSILADPIGQQFNSHTEALTHDFSWCYNILSSAHDRNPLAKINTIFINNVVYNFQAGYTVADTSGNFSHDIINNYFITGPSTTSPNDNFFQMDGNQSIYSTGNLLDSDNNGALGGSSTAPGGVVALSSPWSSLTPTIPIYPTATAYRYDLSMAGALPHDQVDQLVDADVASLGTSGRMWTSQSSTGLGNSGYGVINGGVAPIETDGDGIPDYWKEAVGLNLNVNAAMTIAGDGYANIEHYLNWLASPHALTSTNAPVDVDLWSYTGGFTNASPVYVLSSASNGVVVLNSGHIAHFTPTLNFSGLGGFQFAVTAGGSSYSNTVNVLMTPIAPPQNLVWQGDGIANVWTNGGPANWLNGTNPAPFASGDNVTFDDTGANTPAINLASAISAGTVYILADNQDYTFAGSGYLAGGTALFKTGAGQLNLDTTNTATGGTLIDEGVVQVGDGVTDNGGLAGNVTNNDTLIYATPGTLTSTVNISGSGTVTETGPGMLTISGTQTYNGPTTINAGALTLSGTLPPSDITNNGSLTLAPTSFQIYTNILSGPGNISVNASGVLSLSGSNTFTGNLTNNNGFLILSNNQAAGSGSITYNGGFVVVANGITITNNFYIPTSTSDLNMMATNTGTGTWAGNITLGGNAQWRPGADGGTLQFLGNASMGAHIFIVPRGAVTFASNAVATSTVSGVLGRDGSANKRSTTILIRDNASVAMVGGSLGGGKVGGSVTITVQNNGSLSFGAGTVDLHNIANSAAVSTLRLNGGTTTVGGFTKTQTTYTNIIDFNGGVLQAGAASSAFLPGFNFTTNAVQAGGAIINDGGFAITINGPLIHDPGLGVVPDGGLTKLGAGTLTLGSFIAGVQQTYTGPTIISAGTLVLVSSITNSAGIYVGSGAVLDIPVGSFSVTGGRTLWGNGLVMGNSTAIAVGNGATLAPGSNSIGTLTFSNSLTLASGSTNLFELSHSPLANDSVVVFGALTNGGTLIITNLGGTQLAAGDSFTLFSAASYTGSFTTVKLPPLPFGLAWNTNSLNTAGTISVVLTTTPVIGSVSLSGAGLGLSGTGGVGTANFILLGTTNLGGPWTPLLTNQFDAGGNFNVTNPLDAGSQQSFYRLQLQ